MKTLRRVQRVLACSLGLVLIGPGASHSDDHGVPATTAEAPVVDLDKLLKLPRSVEYGVEKRGGATANEWRERFLSAHTELDDARAELAKSREELEAVATNSEDWQFAPPGLGGANSASSPVSYQLREAIKRQRSEVERTERQLKDLSVEADLASVPQSWRLGPHREVAR